MSALDDFAGLLADADADGREKLLAQARMRALQATDPDKLDAAPTLLTGEELAAERARHLDGAGAIIGELGYSEDRARLAADDPTAKAARTAVADQLVSRFGIDGREADSIVKDAATGRSGEPFRVLDYAAVENTEPRAWLTPGRWYERFLHLLYGREGTNKTILVLRDLCDLAMQGRHVVLVEYEIDEEETARLIEELGFDRKAVAPYLHEIAPEHPFDADLLATITARWPKAEALVLDNLSEATVSAGGDEDRVGDMLRTLTPLRDLAHHRGTAVIAIDHLPHSREHSARGSTAKGQTLDVGYSLAAKPPVTRERPGKLLLTCRKDRGSRVGKGTELWFDIGDGAGNLPITPVEAPERGTLTDEQVAMVVALEKHAESNPSEPELPATPLLQLAGLARTQKRMNALAELPNNAVAGVSVRVVLKGANGRPTTLYRAEGRADDHDLLDL